MCHVRIHRGAGDPDPPPLKNHKNIQFVSKTGPDLLPSQHSMLLGNYRPARNTPFKWRLAGGPMMARLLWLLNPH